MAEPVELKTLDEFLFRAPLYEFYKLPDDLEIVKCLYGRAGTLRVDGHCPFCRRSSTFKIHGQWVPNGDPWNTIKTRWAFDEMRIECARNEAHLIRYYFKIGAMKVQKVGQFPSLADIANDEVARYRTVMTPENAREFHRAIGLAAHGVGVGSFVYLRRVFERLIYKRFEDVKGAEGWKDEDFSRLRMTEKIDFLKNHLPEFLVSNSRIYAILSIGIHALNEEDCLGYFEVMMQSIVFVLEDDRKRKEETALREKFSKAISEFAPPDMTSVTPDSE